MSRGWWYRLLRPEKLEADLEKEMRFHLEQHTADLIARGTSPAEARRRARMALGGPEQMKEECRDARGTRWLEDAWQDIRYALRTLRQNPAFTAVALGTLALGIGAAAVIFTVVDGVLLKPLPYADPARLTAVYGRTATWNIALFGEQNLAYYDFRDCQAQSRSLDMAGWLYRAGTLSEPGAPEYVTQKEVSAGLFEVLGAKPVRGRTFLREEDRAGATPVAMIGYNLWQERFAGADSAVGATVVVDRIRYTVIGIAPDHFRLGGDDEAGVYTPVGQDPAPFLKNRRPHPIGVIARLRPGFTLGQAQTEFAMLAGRLSSQYPASNAGRTFTVTTLKAEVGDVRGALWLLFAAAGLVLLIACANVASLLLARAVSREREMAMRVALGAGRMRLVRQCLTESAVLGLAGGLLGTALAKLGVKPFVAFWPGILPRFHEVSLDWRVVAFAVAVSLASGLLFGLAPALRVPSRGLEQALRAGARTVAGASRRLHGVFVVSEIALAVVLLVSAGMLGRTLLYLSTLDPGLDIRNVLVARMALPPGPLSNPAQTRAAWQDILDRARRIPGVQAIAEVDTVPMRTGNNQLGYWTAAAVPPENQRPMSLATSVTPDYLQVMGIPLRAGRFVDDRDRLDTERVIVIDEVMAARAFGKDPAVGRRLWIPDMSPGPLRVVGVVGHVRHWGLASDDQAVVRDQFYYPFAQVPDALVRRWSELMSIAVRTRVPPLAIVEALRRELRGATGDQVLYEVRTMEQLASDTLARQRFLLLLFGVFAALALLLACIGIYGVLAYLTGRRVSEIGVRMALGASGATVVRMVLGQSLAMILTGIALGVAGALAAGRVMARLVDGVRDTELPTLMLMIALLLSAGLIASFVPARRASRIDPISALRQE
jgi:predicted permease